MCRFNFKGRHDGRKGSGSGSRNLAVTEDQNGAEQLRNSQDVVDVIYVDFSELKKCLDWNGGL